MKKQLASGLLIASFILIADSVPAQKSAPDTVITEDYPVNDKMLRENDSASYSMKSAGIYSRDKIWFTNDNLNQTLIFELYTDYHRLEIYHFMNDMIPDELLDQIELHVLMSQYNNIFDLASLEQKYTAMDGLISDAKRIGKPYFVTRRGIALGDKKSRITKIYGRPDTSFVSNGTKILEWSFAGKDDHSPEVKQYVNSGFGQKVTMYFRSEKLIGLVINNEIP